uniref:Uncharacterized protein n=1 Tax=Plectus sambesii TaxID=2011161 RepID=A0A914VY12_9BILA
MSNVRNRTPTWAPHSLRLTDRTDRTDGTPGAQAPMPNAQFTPQGSTLRPTLSRQPRRTAGPHLALLITKPRRRSFVGGPTGGGEAQRCAVQGMNARSRRRVTLPLVNGRASSAPKTPRVQMTSDHVMTRANQRSPSNPRCAHSAGSVPSMERHNKRPSQAAQAAPTKARCPG